MNLIHCKFNSWFISWVFILLLSSMVYSNALAARKVSIAIIEDGPQTQLEQIKATFVDELGALLEGEFEVSYRSFTGNWTQTGIQQAFNDAYAARDIDMLLVVGVLANQLTVAREVYPKPTFAPFVFGGELLGAPRDGNGSGKTNLNYLSDSIGFDQDIRSFRRIVDFQRVTLIVDEVIPSSLPQLVAEARRMAAEQGVEVSFVTHDGSEQDLAQRIPGNTEGVMFAGLPRMSTETLQRLINDINARYLPSFSLVGEELVRAGVLASDHLATDWQRLARRNALNMQAVLLGEQAADQPVGFQGKRVLTLNMDTARQIGVSPRFDILSEANLLNEDATADGPELSLVEAAAEAEEKNMSLLASRLGVDAGYQDVIAARANLLPQLSLAGSYLQRDVTPTVISGALTERSTDAALTLSQVIYSDDVSAAYTIQKSLQQSAEAALTATRLDVIQQTAIGFLNIQRAKTQLRIQQDNLNLTKTNLDLARDRVRLGSSSAADVYRWESQMASARAAVLTARANVRTTEEALNRLLHRPLQSPLNLQDVQLGPPLFSMSEEEFDALVDNPYRAELMLDATVEGGLLRAPELAQINYQREAKLRELKNRRREFWLPDFTLQGQYSDNLDTSGVGSAVNSGLDDWNVSVNASIPLFSGGARKSALAKTDLELEQLEAQLVAAQEQIEQNIRANMHLAFASYENIDLSEEAALASNKNLELITDSYAKGVVSIIDLLDAQNSSLQANENAANAVYDFLIDFMNLQRAEGQFVFTFSDAERQRDAEQFRQHISSGGQR